MSLNWRAELLFQSPDGPSDLGPSSTCLCEPLRAYIIDSHSFPEQQVTEIKDGSNQ